MGCVAYVGEREMQTEFWLVNLLGSDHLVNLNIDSRQVR